MKLIQNGVLPILLMGALTTQAQELVPNNSFESYTSLPDSWGQWERSVGWNNAGGEPEGGYYADPEYFHMEGSGAADLPNVPPATVNPHTGDAVMAFLGYHDPSGDSENIREYLSVELSEAMAVGNIYSISFWTTNGESGIGHYYKCNGIGILLSTSELNQTGTAYINHPPQIEIEGELFSTEWEKHTFSFEADSAYTHLTIGNFYSDEETSVSVAIDGPLPFAGAYYFVDDFSVTPTAFSSIKNATEEITVQLYPNPANDQVKIVVPNEKRSNYSIFDMAGKLVSDGVFKGSALIHLETFATGTYWVNITQGEAVWKEKLVIK